MISKKLIKSYDFDSIEDYFNYIVDPKINGNRRQAQELYNNLSVLQRIHFNKWFLTFYHYEAADNGQENESEYLNLITYLNS